MFNIALRDVDNVIMAEFHLENLLKLQYFIPLICCNKVGHSQYFWIILIPKKL